MPTINPIDDWKRFCNCIPKPMQGVLDDFQPVIFLGHTSSEKERIVLQQSGVADNERRLQGKASYCGKALSVYLGARTLVLVPSDEFLSTQGAASHPGWTTVIRRVCRTRVPLVVVCLSQASVDQGATDDIAQWASGLRMHLDLITSTRNEDVEVSLVLAQPYRSENAAPPTLMDAWFELLLAMKPLEYPATSSSISLEGLTGELTLDVEKRRWAAQQWVSQRLSGYRQLWPCLLARADESAARVLQYLAAFESLEQLTASLGASLSELLYQDESRSHNPRGLELVFLPCQQDAQIGNLEAFRKSPENPRQWRPSRTLLQRLLVTTGVVICVFAIWVYYGLKQSEWDRVAAVASEYDPVERPGRLKDVREYSLQLGPIASAQSAASWLVRLGHWVRSVAVDLFLNLDFYDRDLPRCVAVTNARTHLENRLRTAIENEAPPEKVLPIASLYLSGDPWDCDTDPKLVKSYQDLMATIIRHSGYWQSATDMRDEDIEEYLKLACPWKQDPPWIQSKLKQYSANSRTAASWPTLPDVARLARSLATLSGSCELPSGERKAIEQLQEDVDRLGRFEDNGGSAYEAFRGVQGMPTPAMKALAGAIGPFVTRLSSIEALAIAHEDIELVARDVRGLRGRVASDDSIRGFSVAEFNEALNSQLREETLDPERTELNIRSRGETFLIDRKKVHASLFSNFLGQLGDDFRRNAAARTEELGTREAIFFSGDDYHRSYRWLKIDAAAVGLEVVGVVPWRYSLEALKLGVLKPLEFLHQLVQSQPCRAFDENEPPNATTDELLDFARSYFDDYLGEYEAAWLRVYDSFQIVAHRSGAFDDQGLAETLMALTRPSSPQLAMLQEIVRQTTVPVSDDSPYAASLRSFSDRFVGLAQAVDEKAFLKYQGLLRDLAKTASATSKRSTSNPTKEKSARDATEEAFANDSPGTARVLIAGLRDPEQDTRTRVNAWLDEVGVEPNDRQQFLQPVDAIYKSGWVALDVSLREFWGKKRAELAQAVGERFPFGGVGQDTKNDAVVSDVTDWLAPGTGRFFTEVEPVYALVNRCRDHECPSVLKEMTPVVNRLRAISRELFDQGGKPKSLELYWKPMPTKEPLVLSSTLRLGVMSIPYFNTKPQASKLSVVWNEQYDACLEVEVVNEEGADSESVSPLCRHGSWALFHLLADATKKPCNDGGYELKLPRDGNSDANKGLPIRFQVYSEPSRCNELFPEVFRWQ